MATLMQENTRAYRVVVKRTDKETKEVRMSYFGPYASKGAAKGRATVLRDDCVRWDKTGVHSSWVQATTGAWEDML